MEMEDADEFEFERIRLKRLLVDKLLEVEKENMEMLNNGFCDRAKLPKSIHTLGSYTKIEPPKKLTPYADKTNAKEKSGNFRNTSSKSTICPKLSDMNSNKSSTHSNMHFLNRMEHSLLHMKKRALENEAKTKYFPCAIPLSPPVRIRKEENAAFLSDKNYLDSQEDSLNKINIPKDRNKVLVVQRLPSITISRETSVKSVAVETQRDIGEAINSCHASSSATLLRTNFAEEKCFSEHFSSPIAFTSVKSLDEDISCKKPSQNAPKEKVLSHLEKNFTEAKKEECGLNLNLSLDSTFTKDVLKRLLQGLPQLLNHETSNPSACEESPLQKSSDECYGQQSKPETSINDTSDERKSTKSIPLVNSFAQTDQSMSNHLHQQPEFLDLIKNVVKDTLQSLNSDELHFPKTFASHKVDSGIQSEIESDVAVVRKDVYSSGDGILLNGGYIPSSKVSIGIQVQEKQQMCDKNINTSFDESILKVSAKDESVEMFLTPNTPSKMEATIEKIYEHLCSNGEVNKCIDSYERPAISTREVAVQFNPLHTSNKGTSTAEIKTVESSTQHDAPYVVCPAAKSNASVQIPASFGYDVRLLKNAFTQYEATSVRENAIQTDEFNVYHNSLSSTPVSDNMFMDDLISEGEIPLPWNLRLLSNSGGVYVSNTDSSDISCKEKDYSLSEGEIPPHLLHYSKLSSCSNCCDPGSIPTGQFNNANIQHASRIGLTNHAESSSERPPSFCPFLSSPSDGEIDMTNLSLGEVPPTSKLPIVELSCGETNHSISSGEIAPSVKLVHPESSYFGLNTSVSFEEAAPVFTSPLAESSRISNTHPSFRVCENSHCSHTSSN